MRCLQVFVLLLAAAGSAGAATPGPLAETERLFLALLAGFAVKVPIVPVPWKPLS